MELTVVKIGNSRGLRIPKSLLERCHIEDKVEVEVSGRSLLIRPKERPRQGWAQAAATMHRLREDRPPYGDDLDAHVHKEWKW
jgi:antitoxin MazE